MPKSQKDSVSMGLTKNVCSSKALTDCIDVGM